MKKRLLFTMAGAAFSLAFSVPAPAMDRWTALSMLESGDNDRAVGTHGEISRYQILRELWPGGNPQDSEKALNAARNIMDDRLTQFQQTHGRSANDFEFYVLWNAPAEVNHPSKAVKARAQRFVNLVSRKTEVALK